jgi:tRNA(fMet)-specific endonuclease VapC
MMFLLDTNIISDLMRRPEGAVARRLASLTTSSIVLCPVVACEIAAGLARVQSPRLEAAWSLIRSRWKVVPLGGEVAPAYASLRRALEASGMPIGPNDLLIAAHALTLEAVVVTDNVREFSRVPGLRVENWLAAEGGSP